MFRREASFHARRFNITAPENMSFKRRNAGHCGFCLPIINFPLATAAAARFQIIELSVLLGRVQEGGEIGLYMYLKKSKEEKRSRMLFRNVIFSIFFFAVCGPVINDGFDELEVFFSLSFLYLRFRKRRRRHSR